MRYFLKSKEDKILSVNSPLIVGVLGRFIAFNEVWTKLSAISNIQL